MRRRRLEPTEPTPANRAKIERLTSVLVPPVRLALEAVAPLRWSGVENIPEGPALVVSNHVSLLDPFFIITAANRPVHFLATAAGMEEPFIGRVLQAWGSVPKKKFTVDPGAVRRLKHWLDLGARVGSFPEGERSWDGKLMPLVPGIESLVRLLKVPVLPVRILNADRVMPRWAVVRRYGPVTVIFGRPRSFERKTPPAEIRRWIEDHIRVDPDNEHVHAPVHGLRLALGLDNPLYRCPGCFAWDALRTAGSEVRCRECGARWRVDTRNRLVGRGGAPSMTIVEARAAIRERSAARFIVDERRFEREGVVATSEVMTLLDITEARTQTLGRGRMELLRDTLRVRALPGRPRAGELLLELPLAEILATVIEMRRRLTFRTRAGRLYEAVLPRESPLKWLEIVEHWRRLADTK